LIAEISPSLLVLGDYPTVGDSEVQVGLNPEGSTQELGKRVGPILGSGGKDMKDMIGQEKIMNERTPCSALFHCKSKKLLLLIKVQRPRERES
jgi:hypothetical protein